MVCCGDDDEKNTNLKLVLLEYTFDLDHNDINEQFRD